MNLCTQSEVNRIRNLTSHLFLAAFAAARRNLPATVDILTATIDQLERVPAAKPKRAYQPTVDPAVPLPDPEPDPIPEPKPMEQAVEEPEEIEEPAREFAPVPRRLRERRRGQWMEDDEDAPYSL